MEAEEADYLGRTDRKQLSTHTQGNNSTVLEVQVEVEAGIQGKDY